MSFIDMSGMKFGRLTAVSYLTQRPNYWQCVCECGTEKQIFGADLRRGKSKSCGCAREEAKIKHGRSRTREYTAWMNMTNRCRHPSYRHFNHYGGRGIKVCERWKDFESFFEDMGLRPSPEHSVERKDVNGNYEPSNCYWATTTEQARNKRMLVSKSGIPGISWKTKNNKWIVRITINRKSIYIGSFFNMDEAIKARKQAETEYWGKESS